MVGVGTAQKRLEEAAMNFDPLKIADTTVFFMCLFVYVGLLFLIYQKDSDD